MDLDKISLGKELQSIRKELNLTIEEASFLSCVNEKTIYRIEHGINKVSKNTLDKLSLAYKKDLFSVYNKYTLNPKIKLFNIIDKAEKSLYVDNLKSIETCINQLRKLPLKEFTSYEEIFIRYYIKFLEATRVDLKDNRLEAVKLLINAIKSEINSFQIRNYRNFNYSPIEKRILMNISIMAYSFYEDKIFMEILTYLSTLTNDDITLYPKLILNLSTLCYKNNDYEKSLYFVNQGIDYCIKRKSLDVLPKFFFRKFTLEFRTDMKNYKNALEKAIFLAEINNQEYLKDIFITNAESIYGIRIKV